MHVSLGSPLGRAPAVAGERVVVVTICPLRRLRRHLSQRERLYVTHIITQIGRENNLSAEVYVSWTVEDACPYDEREDTSSVLCANSYEISTNTIVIKALMSWRFSLFNSSIFDHRKDYDKNYKLRLLSLYSLFCNNIFR